MVGAATAQEKRTDAATNREDRENILNVRWIVEETSAVLVEEGGWLPRAVELELLLLSPFLVGFYTQREAAWWSSLVLEGPSSSREPRGTQEGWSAPHAVPFECEAEVSTWSLG